jgi:hypothetical protein
MDDLLDPRLVVLDVFGVELICTRQMSSGWLSGMPSFAPFRINTEERGMNPAGCRFDLLLIETRASWPYTSSPYRTAALYRRMFHRPGFRRSVRPAAGDAFE